jgi:hypothetical protein
LASKDRDFPLIFSVLATERQPMQGLSSPKFHIQVLIVRASTIGTAALKSVLLSAGVHMWNSGGCISFQKAWNERNFVREVLNPSRLFQSREWDR